MRYGALVSASAASKQTFLLRDTFEVSKTEILSSHRKLEGKEKFFRTFLYPRCIIIVVV